MPRRTRTPLLSVLLLGSLAACGSEPPVMPDVTNTQLDAALGSIADAGVKDDVEVEGGGLFGVIDEGNWMVCGQTPAPGAEVTGAPVLTVARSCDSDSTAQAERPEETSGEAATVEPTTPDPAPTGEETEPTEEETEPAEEEPQVPEPITADSNAAFATLLTATDYCGDDVREFAEDHQGELIQFEGYLGNLMPEGDTNTRYRLLLGAGDFDPDGQPGPMFQFRDVNLVYDLGWSGDRPDNLAVSQNLDITAEILEYEPDTCLFLLDPVTTAVRD